MNNDMPSLRFKRPELLAALEARRPWAARLDAKALAAHQKAEKAYESEFRAACRKAVKWDYATIKKNHGNIRPRMTYAPSCPMSVAVKLEDAIKFVKNDNRISCTVSQNGEWSGVHWLLTHDENPKKRALC